MNIGEVMKYRIIRSTRATEVEPQIAGDNIFYHVADGEIGVRSLRGIPKSTKAKVIRATVFKERGRGLARRPS